MKRELPDAATHANAGASGSAMTLTSLWTAIVRARSCVAAERLDPPRRGEPSVRLTLIEAIEAYLACIATRGYPAPTSLMQELRVQRMAWAPRPGAHS